MTLTLPFYISAQGKSIKVDSPETSATLDSNNTIYVQNIDGNFWLVAKDPLQISIDGLDTVVFGRSKQSHIVLSNSKATRKHCEVIMPNQKQQVVVKDMNSKNGTYINGQEISKPLKMQTQKPFVLRAGNESWKVNLERAFVETHTTKNFHKYPLIGGERLIIGEYPLLVHKYDHGVSDHIGRRRQMEDQHAILPNVQGKSIYMIFDGHGGKEASEFVCDRMKRDIRSLNDIDNFNEIKDMFAKIDEDYLRTEQMAGTTANVVVLSDDTIDVINTGDCQTMVIYENGFKLSKPHRPDQELDRIPPDRLKRDFYNTLRVTGKASTGGGLALSVSRAFGDPPLKDVVISTPEKESYPREEFLGDDVNRALLIVQCCDGVWDFMTPEEVDSFVRELQRHSSQHIASALVKEVYEERFGKDNITALVVKLQ
jgi:protein phosphatase 2C family protein 2/3